MPIFQHGVLYHFFCSDGVSQHCRVCSGKCSECDTSPSHCTSCRAGMELFKNRCLSLEETCPAGRYHVSTSLWVSQHCRVCSGKCAECDTSPSHCTSCRAGMELFKNRCLSLEETCPAGRYHVSTSLWVSQHCRVCSGKCAECDTSPSHCTSCRAGMELFKNRCLSLEETCPAGRYHVSTSLWVSQHCRVCSGKCAECDTSPSHCTSCRAGMELFKNRCLSLEETCPAGRYHVSTSLWVSQHCRVCSGKCAECDTSPSHCTSCRAGMELFKNRCLSLEETCPAGRYHVSTSLWVSQHCRVCSGKCAECDTSPSHCTSCRAGMELFKNRCLSLEETCPAGRYHVSTSLWVSQHCRVCSGKCAECDTSPSHCTSCRAGMELFKNRCLSLEETCPAGRYHVSTSPWVSQHCRVCSGKCAGCDTSPSHCTSCRAGMELFKNRCLSLEETCPAGRYHVSTSLWVSQHCRVCSGKCAECDTSPSHCTSCRAGMELFKNRCLSLEETCPASRYHVSTSLWVGQHCRVCSGKCAECDTSPSHCTSCRAGMELFKNRMSQFGGNLSRR